jgi:hypothetical protein
VFTGAIAAQATRKLTALHRAAKQSSSLQAFAFAFRRSSPNAMLDPILQGIIKALVDHIAVTTDLSCTYDTCTIGRKKYCRIQPPASPNRHPWLTYPNDLFDIVSCQGSLPL